MSAYSFTWEFFLKRHSMKEERSMREKMFCAYICLGSNSFDAKEKLAAAYEILAKYENAKIGAVSRIYLTEPQDYTDQEWFHNQVIRLDYADFSFHCEEEAQKLLQYLLSSELELGRFRDPKNRFGPRCIDLDMLIFGNISIKSTVLDLPHPRMLQRAFVLIPLQEVLTKDMVSILQIPKALSVLSYILDELKIFQN